MNFVEILGWSLVVLAVLLVTGFLGPILGVVLTIAALPLVAVLGVVMLPLLVLVLVVGAVFGMLGLLVQWGLPLLLLAAGVWLIAGRRRPRAYP